VHSFGILCFFFFHDGQKSGLPFHNIDFTQSFFAYRGMADPPDGIWTGGYLAFRAYEKKICLGF